MRSRVFAILVLMFIVSASPSQAALKTLAEWKFGTDGDTTGWNATANVDGLTTTGGYLVGHVSGRDPSVAGPQFEIKASPYQFIEVRMRASKAGGGEVYWTNTTDEPYGGFRPEMVQRISVQDGDFQVFRIFPFWQNLGKIIRLRIDPPENSDFAIDYIKVVEIDVPTSSSPFFDFTKSDQAWYAADDVQTEMTPDGADVKSPGEWMLFSPKVDLDASAFPLFSVWVKSKGAETATLRWMAEGASGFQVYPLKLKADDRWHVYNVEVGNLADWAGRIKMLAMGGNLGDDQRIQIRFAGVTDKRRGPAELEIRSFGFKDPVNRINPQKPSVVQAELVNTGGEPVQDEITVRFRISPGNKLDITPVDLPSAVGLKSGASAILTFAVMPEHAGSSDVIMTVDNAATSASAPATLLWYSPVDVKPSVYVPEPKPVKGDFEVGMYYFPGWNTYRSWSVLNSFPERRPLLGYYREGEPEVADWHIKWMTEHGITFIVYDWYWSAGGRGLEHGIHQGFFNAKYHDKIKFCLLWANHNAPKTSSAEDMVNVTNYWLDNYFTRPDYMKVDGKPVVVIFSPSRLSDDMGAEGVRQAFEKSREMAKARGLAGIYFVACTYPGNAKSLEAQGYDALSGYNYPSAGDNGQLVAPYADNVTGYQDFWNTIADNSNLRYIPVTDPGWDSRPWGGANARVRTGKTPALFKNMLENAKSFVEKRTPNASPKMVLVEAWNEFGEGDYTEPTAGFGFGHLDAIREVFTTAPAVHDDLVPQDVGMKLIEVEKPKPATSWEFKDQVPGWEIMMGLKDLTMVNGSLNVVSNSPDPALTVTTDDLDSKQFRVVEIRMSVDKGKGAQLFWGNRNWRAIEEASATFVLKADGRFHTYRIDLSKAPLWRSMITSLRFDPTDTTDARVAIDYIRFLKK